MKKAYLVVGCISNTHGEPSIEGKFWDHDGEEEQGHRPRNGSVLGPVCSQHLPTQARAPSHGQRAPATVLVLTLESVPPLQSCKVGRRVQITTLFCFVKIKATSHIFCFGEL